MVREILVGDICAANACAWGNWKNLGVHRLSCNSSTIDTNIIDLWDSDRLLRSCS